MLMRLFSTNTAVPLESSASLPPSFTLCMTMTSVTTFIIVIISLINRTTSSESFCGLDDKSCDNNLSSPLLVDKRWNHYLKAIDEANASFRPCIRSSCECFTSQILEDLKPWIKTGISKDDIDKGKKFGVHFQVINHQIRRQSDCLFPARCQGVEYFLKKIVKHLNDTEFVMNFHDWPQIPRTMPNIPVFSFSKTPDYQDIMFPAWAFHTGGPAIDLYPRGIGDWSGLRERIIKKSPLWEKKLSKGFFRGSRTSPERDPLILLSRSEPDLIDAQYTKNQAWRSLKDTLGQEPAPTVSFEEQCAFKYLVNMRGVAASFRYKHLFLCNSVILNVESDWIEFFYPQLHPWIHYVPVEPDMHDLKDKLLFLREHDEIAKKIARQGFDLIYEKLTEDNIICYWKHLITLYSSLLKFPVIPDPSLHPIK